MSRIYLVNILIISLALQLEYSLSKKLLSVPLKKVKQEKLFTEPIIEHFKKFENNSTNSTLFVR